MSQRDRNARALTKIAEDLDFEVKRTAKGEYLARHRRTGNTAHWAGTSTSSSGFLNARAQLRRAARLKEQEQ